jgi:hypothetical protein
MEPDQTDWTALEVAIYEMARWFEPLGVRAVTLVLEDGTVKATVRDGDGIRRFVSSEYVRPEVEAD